MALTIAAIPLPHFLPPVPGVIPCIRLRTLYVNLMRFPHELESPPDLDERGQGSPFLGDQSISEDKGKGGDEGGDEEGY